MHVALGGKKAHPKKEDVDVFQVLQMGGLGACELARRQQWRCASCSLVAVGIQPESICDDRPRL